MTVNRCRLLHITQLVQRLPELSVRPEEVAGTVLASAWRTSPLHCLHGHLLTPPQLWSPA